MVAIAQSDREFLDQTAKWLRDGNPKLAEALPRVYDELRDLANSYMRRERSDHTLQPTALVHEAYLRLRTQRNVDWSSHAQFLGIAAQIMRRILVNYAEARAAEKRGGGCTHDHFEAALAVLDREAIPTLDVNRALNQLATLDPRQARIAELRFFGGLTVPQTAEVLGISTARVKREWTIAKMWLERAITQNS